MTHLERYEEKLWVLLAEGKIKSSNIEYLTGYVLTTAVSWGGRQYIHVFNYRGELLTKQ